MSSSTQLDCNYVSLSNNNWAIYKLPDTSSVAQYFYPSSLPSTIIYPVNPNFFAGILKLCDNSSITLTGLVVAQGYESSVDINNHATVNISGDFGTDVDKSGYQIISVKGGSSAVISGVLHGSGNRMDADIIVNQWSDQSYNSSTIDISQLTHHTGRKIKVVKRLGGSTVIGECELLVWESIKLTLYWYIKLVARKLLRIPVGVKGPSWL